MSSRSKIALAATWFSSVSRDALGLLGGQKQLPVDLGSRGKACCGIYGGTRHIPLSGEVVDATPGSPGHDWWSRRRPPCREPNLPMEQQVRGRVWVRQRGSAILPPTSGQSIQQWIYDYSLRDEFAVNTYWIEWYQDCLNACQRLVREGKMPSDMYDRVKRNFCDHQAATRASQHRRTRPDGATATIVLEA